MNLDLFGPGGGAEPPAEQESPQDRKPGGAVRAVEVEADRPVTPTPSERGTPETRPGPPGSPESDASARAPETAPGGSRPPTSRPRAGTAPAAAGSGPSGAPPGARTRPRQAPATERPGGPRVWTVSQINRAVRSLLEDTLPAVWVSGEVANWTRSRSGHCYFTLKDEQAQLRSVMFRSDAFRLPTDPEEGMRVRAFGSLTLYEARGEYQLVVRALEAEGSEGLWRLAFERLRTRLEAEGLLDPARKRPLPRFPRTIGVVTSTTGAAIRDILTVVERRAPWTRVLVRSTRVQGDGAGREVAEAIRVLGCSGLVDVLVVGRGGGSIEDLWAFNEEPVARAIVECPVPVISAVGHEVDVTIADLVADARAPTPSAAGEAAVPDREALLRSMRAVHPRLVRGLRACVQRRRRDVRVRLETMSRDVRRLLEPRRRFVADRSARLERGVRRLVEPRRGAVSRTRDRLERAVRRLVEPRRHAVFRAEERLERGMRALLERRGERLAGLAGRLEALSPLSALRRGYAVPLRADGSVLRRTEEFEEESEFSLRVVDGRVACRVLDTRKSP